eukprot:COSAG02_NODE_384_length_23406_cov_9.459733_15_plen_160_part_00
MLLICAMSPSSAGTAPAGAWHVLEPATLRSGEADKITLALKSHVVAPQPGSKANIIEIPLGKTPKLTGGSFLPPNAVPTGRSFAAAFPKRWEPPGTSRQRGCTGLPSVPKHTRFAADHMPRVFAARLETFSHASVATAMDWHYAMVRAHSTLRASLPQL